MVVEVYPIEPLPVRDRSASTDEPAGAVDELDLTVFLFSIGFQVPDDDTLLRIREGLVKL